MDKLDWLAILAGVMACGIMVHTRYMVRHSNAVHWINTAKLRSDIMTKLDDLMAKMAEETTLVASMGAYVAGLKKEIADLLTGVELPGPVQAQLDNLLLTEDNNIQALTSALAANTPAGVPTKPAPEPVPTDPQAVSGLVKAATEPKTEEPPA